MDFVDETFVGLHCRCVMLFISTAKLEILCRYLDRYNEKDF